MGIVTSISIKLQENFVDFITKKIEEYSIPRIQEHVGYLGLTAASVLLLLFVVVNFFGWKLGRNLVNSILEKIGENCVPQIIREQVGYLIHYNRNSRTLKNEVEELDRIKSRVQHDVDAAKDNARLIEDGVDIWLKEVDEMKRTVDRFFQVIEENKRCLGGWCPNLSSRYMLSKEAAENTKVVIQLQQKGSSFRSVSYSARREIEYPATGTSADFVSRKSLFEEIMAALKDDDLNAIGICGLGGIGKTTMAKEVLKKAREEKLFDEVVMATVSENPDFKTIQNEIADNLHLEFKEQSLPGRATQLQARLKNSKKVLVILDDVWKTLDLGLVGIPFGDDNKGCKVMLTSRSLDVCEGMKTRRDFTIEVLSEPEAWKLFKEKAGNSIESPDLHPIALQVVNKCGGLPLAIATVGSALKNAKKHRWNDALRKLRMPNPENVPDFLRDVYGKLVLSYDFLKDQEAKSLLLLCCIFEEDTDIPISDLVRYGMGLRMFRGIDALADATDTVRTLVDNLKRCNLLLDNGKEDCVRMHDMVRDVIRFKATEGKEAFMPRYGLELKERPTKGTDEQYASVSLISKSNEIHDHPKQLARPKPDLLLLEGIHRYQEVPNNLEFEGMEELKVLQMGLMVIPSSPTSLSYLTNLRALCLHNCELESISTIGELQMLVILSFRSSSITELPREIGRLTHLRLLDLRYCTSLKIVSPGVISSLTRLEELYLEGSGLKWVVEERGKAQNEVNLAELGFLSNLSALVSHLPTTKFSGGINLFDKLVRFQLLISNDKFPPFCFSGANEFQNCLELKDIDATTLADGGTQVLLKKTNSLKIRGVRGMEHVLNNHDTTTHHLFNEEVKSLCELRFMDVYGCEKLLNVFSSNLVQSLQNLEELKVQECYLLEVVFDFEGVNIEEGHAALVFPCLKKLELQSLPSLTYLFNEKVKSLCELRFMDVNGCKKLLNVFSSNLVQSLQNLEEVKVQKCDSLEVVFDFEGVNIEEGHAALVLPGLKKLELQILPSLTHLWPSQEIQGCQNLQSLVVTHCQKLKYIFTPSIAKHLVKLENLRISECATVELIVGNDQEGSKENKEATKIIVFPKVKHLHLGNLPDLVSFGPEPYTFKWPVLKELSLRNANVKVFTPAILGTQEQRTINMRSHEEVQEQQITFPSLVVLEIEDENNVERILNGLLPADSLCKLRQIRVFKCNDLSNAVPSNLLSALHKLEELSIEECDSLVEVFEVEGLNVEEGDRVLLPNLKKLNLERLPELKSILKRLPKGFLFFQRLEVLQVGRCKNLRNLFSPSMVRSVEQLQELEISDCKMMTEIVAEDEGEGDEKAMDKIEFPKLRRLTLVKLPNLVSFSPKVNTTALNPEAIDVDYGEILPEFNLHTQIQYLFNEKVAFPSLEELSLIGMFEINEVWCEMDHEGTKAFQNLESLHVSDCGSLRNVFYPSMARGLVHLKYLAISNCKMMEEIVVKGENEEDDRTDKIVIYQLEELKLSRLPSLTSFCQGLYPFDLPSLMHVSINRCPKMMTFSLDSPVTPKLQKVEGGFYSGKPFWMGDLNKTIQQLFVRKFTFPGGTELRLSHNDDVERILHNLQPDRSLSKLREMHVEECNKLLHVIPSNFLQSFGNLEELTVRSCASLVEVFEVEGLNVEERDTVVLSKLEKLHLKDLTELKHLFNEKVLFPSLEKLILFHGLKSVRVECCGSLRNLFYPLMARGLVHLEELVIEHCNMMEEIISKGEEEEEEGMNTIMAIPQLKRLKLYHLPNLVSFCRGHYAFDLPSLVDVFVFDCPKMKTFSSGFVSTKGLKQVHYCKQWGWSSDIRQSSWMGDLNDTIQQLFQTKFTFHGTTELEHILHTLPPDRSLCQLRVMHLQECNKLSIAVPSNLLSALQNLEELSIENCDSLVEIFEVERLNVEEGNRVLLPNLEKLKLKDLPELKHILKRQPKGFQSLSILQVEGCKNLRNLFSPSMVKSVKQLQELKISNCEKMTEIVVEDRGEGDEKAMDKIEFPQLRRLALRELPNLVSFSPKVNTTALNPEAIDVDSGEILPEFNLHTQIQHLFNEKVAFPSLESLSLSGMFKINEVWCKMDHEGTKAFQNLKSLRVSGCGSLRNVFYPSMARGLVHLKYLDISNCEMMEEIVVKGENEEEDRTDKIVIYQLEKLELFRLPSLTSFCQGLYPFDLPSLMHVSIDQCPKMTTFSLDSPFTPKLQKVKERFFNDKSFWMGDLNKTIQQLFARKELEHSDSSDFEED